MSMAENNELRILNSFLTKGSFILSQELELVDRFLGKYDTQTPFSNKLGRGERGRQVRLAREGKKWYVQYSLCYMCPDCNWLRILSGDILERLYLINSVS